MEKEFIARLGKYVLESQTITLNLEDPLKGTTKEAFLKATDYCKREIVEKLVEDYYVRTEKDPAVCLFETPNMAFALEAYDAYVSKLNGYAIFRNYIIVEIVELCVYSADWPENENDRINWGYNGNYGRAINVGISKKGEA